MKDRNRWEHVLNYLFQTIKMTHLLYNTVKPFTGKTRCMKIVILSIAVFFLSAAYGQYPYAKKISFPEQLPTQVVYGMITDSKGYMWLGTDKGLYRFNGRTFVAVPFDNTLSKTVSYLQEDKDGAIWCMNFYGQIFFFQKDTVRRFDIDYKALKGLRTFNNMVVGPTQVWLQSFSTIYEIDKTTHAIRQTIVVPHDEQVVSSVLDGDTYRAYTQSGFLFSDKGPDKGWKYVGQKYYEFKFIKEKQGVLGIPVGNGRTNAFELKNQQYRSLPSPDLFLDAYIFHGVCIDENEYWLCTKKGAYKWNKETGETKCYFPNQRVSDVVRDYQGNYWFSTLDDGVFICTSLNNSLLKRYQDPLLDNFTRLQLLPNREIIAGNTSGMMTRINLETNQAFEYDLDQQREIEFIRYDTTANLVISNRGIFKPDQKKAVELVDYGKGVERDKFGNLLVAIFNQAFIMNDRFGSTSRMPVRNCPLYQGKLLETIKFAGKYWALMFRGRRGISVLASRKQEGFWIGYEDDLYEYHYDGTIRTLRDMEGKTIVAKSLQQKLNGDLIVGTSTKGVMIFRNGTLLQTFDDRNGLSSVFVRKVLRQDQYIWVLTDAGLDRIDLTNGSITNYLEEYGLSNTIVNDFVIDHDKIIFATTSGILVRYNKTRTFDFEIRFPLLKATSDGTAIQNKVTLPGKDISFYFEALHYLSTTALTYQYRLKGLDTLWRTANNFSSQLSFNSLGPGKYIFEIKAHAGPNYKSAVRSFSFTVPRPWWQKAGFFVFVLAMAALLLSLFLYQWKKSLLRRQKIKEQLLKSQLVALRAQMNPHFLYNVLNTVQGLVYGNRKTEAGELLGNFSDLMRKTLQASDKQLLPLQDEIENLRLYLELEKARFDEGFSYRIDLINIDDLTSIFIPSLMLQPFAENSVKHGLMHKQGSKEVEILFEKRVDGLTVVIDDNGIGRLHSMEINQRSHNKPFSFATVALNERMALFNRLYKQKITCRIIDKVNEKQESLGTRIELFIPDYSNDPHAL
jgi:ligand-binding sensor domain-containing protein